MSRIGRAPIEIPAGVTVTVGEDNLVKVKGPKGELSRQISPEMKVTIDNGVLTVERPSDDKMHRSLHGLSRTLINNMVVGVTEGYQKNLEIAGVGYRAQKQGKNLNLSLGFSHPVVVEPPEGITFDVPTATSITVSGIDKEVVGQIAAEIRSFREPEPYKGKGIKYAGEHIRRKEGKAGAKGKK
ncbi:MULTISPECIES: 50S ribosomal protein L6 [unclassified Selenomonas]|jgi:large subunit ribosomal protein L6|uniref:50S ribosomal protein L6 n=1 Tax=unclassified Selenomonas TaxID=2637378 RepID=UPI0004969013|nr:large subunit ribosomal protein L6 [Selenomonas ruminantium]